VNICVFCGSSSGVGRVYRDAAEELGRLIAQRGHTLVYGGTRIGLMGILAEAARSAGGRVVSVIPRRLAQHGIADESVDELLITQTMAERKEVMESRSDAFIALPGGFGTVEELAQVITLKQLRYLQAPIVLLNTAGFYEHLLAHLEHLYQTGFAHAAYRKTYATVATPSEALDYIESYQPVTVQEKWEPPSA